VWSRLLVARVDTTHTGGQRRHEARADATAVDREADRGVNLPSPPFFFIFFFTFSEKRKKIPQIESPLESPKRPGGMRNSSEDDTFVSLAIRGRERLFFSLTLFSRHTFFPLQIHPVAARPPRRFRRRGQTACLATLARLRGGRQRLPPPPSHPIPLVVPHDDARRHRELEENLRRVRRRG